MELKRFSELFYGITGEIRKALLGQDHVVEPVLLSILCGGHTLLEGVPGLGKTLLARTFGACLGLEHKRIQFTPDLMPSDITGGNVFDQKQGEFVFIQGPVFTQLLLADEINRAPAKTQSALLEAMQDQSVSADGVTHPLPAPFIVLATQNSVESQGTYPLPEAQLDRFLVKLDIHYPSVEVETQLLKNVVGGFRSSDLKSAGVVQVGTTEDLLEMRKCVDTIRVSDELLRYITGIVAASRSHRSIYLGASPRASIGILNMARTRAASQSRDFVTPDDVKLVAKPVLRHRIILHPDAEIQGVQSDECVDEILRSAPVPHTVA